jgi:hypothetical protein
LFVKKLFLKRSRFSILLVITSVVTIQTIQFSKNFSERSPISQN